MGTNHMKRNKENKRGSVLKQYFRKLRRGYFREIKAIEDAFYGKWYSPLPKISLEYAYDTFQFVNPGINKEYSGDVYMCNKRIADLKANIEQVSDGTGIDKKPKKVEIPAKPSVRGLFDHQGGKRRW